MLVVMKAGAGEEEIGKIVQRVEEVGFRAHVSRGEERTVIGIVGVHGDRRKLEDLEAIESVEKLIPISKPYKLSSRQFKPQPTTISVAGLTFGSREIVVMAGPCAVEKGEHLFRTAETLKQFGAHIFRAGAFKPRSSPYSFQGLGLEGLRILEEIRNRTGLGIITEALSIRHLEDVARVTDIIQIGTRNAQNFELIREAARTGKPILLKRGMACTVEEWLLAAEYVLQEGNPNLILCERGIRGFDHSTRNVLDLAAAAIARRESHLPVVVDPSHATGHREIVPAMARAAVAAGLDGLLIEVHVHPEEAWTDGAETITVNEFGELMGTLRTIAATVDRVIPD
jgi:3-deoxy-7-phosphoheptulonate synthase